MLAVLGLVIIGLSLVIGLVRPGEAIARVGRLVAILAISPFLFALALWIWHQILLFPQSVLLLLGFPVLFITLVRLLFGRHVYSQFMGHLIYDVFRFLMRLLLWAGALCLEGFAMLRRGCVAAIRGLRA